MGLFNRPAKLGAKLATWTTLLLRADPGDALLDAARRYDPQVRRVRDRLVFQNGVLLIGPVTMTPEIERRAGLPAGMAVAWYVGAGGLSASQRRSHEAVVDDGDHLVTRARGPAGRDRHAAYSPEDAGREVCLKVGSAALVLAGESGGIALDVLGFIINSADDLLPRSR